MSFGNGNVIIHIYLLHPLNLFFIVSRHVFKGFREGLIRANG